MLPYSTNVCGHLQCTVSQPDVELSLNIEIPKHTLITMPFSKYNLLHFEFNYSPTAIIRTLIIRTPRLSEHFASVPYINAF